MKINSKKNPPRKSLLHAKLFSTVVLALLLVCSFFMRYSATKVITLHQLVLSLVFIMVYMDYMIYKLRYDIFGDIGGGKDW